MTNSKNPAGQTKKQITGASEFITEAYNLEDPVSMKQFYAKWADDYDNQMTQNLSYISPKLIAQAMQQFLPEKSSSILDFGCGTGLTANQMYINGYANLYGIDLSEDMINVATRRGIYKGLKTGDVNQPLEYEDNQFEGVISSGTFTHGHVGPEPLPEIVRILKPRGILACSVHIDLWQSRGFEQAFDQLESNGSIRCLSREFDRHFEDSEPKGWFCVYQKTA